MSKASSMNRYMRRLGLGMSATGLGLSVANFVNSKHNSSVNQRQKDLQAQILNALKAIHSTLASNQTSVPEITPTKSHKV